jgi:hypothetical protein
MAIGRNHSITPTAMPAGKRLEPARKSTNSSIKNSAGMNNSIAGKYQKQGSICSQSVALTSW